MPLFPSQEWMEAFCERVRSHPDAPEAAEALRGVYRFVVEPAGPLRQRHVYDMSIEPSGSGAGPTVTCLDGEHMSPRLTLTADYSRWRQLILGELDLTTAFMLRRLRVSGDLGPLLSRASSARPLTDALGQVDSRFPDG
ncbi:hypothetical protein BH20ACT9_BH20ACT9_03940 [soil metagenome]